MNKKKRVLIIDDEKDICFLLSSLLSNMGYDVYESYSLQEGLNVFKNIHPEVIFLDINLPDGSGLNVISELKEVEQAPKVIMVSAYDGYTQKNLAYEDGADSFLSKPFSRESVLKALDNNAEKKQVS